MSVIKSPPSAQHDSGTTADMPGLYHADSLQSEGCFAPQHPTFSWTKSTAFVMALVVPYRSGIELILLKFIV